MDEVRVDKWLWAARLFKTRSLAQAAVRGGHVELNGHGCKPARMLRVGDRLRVVRGDEVFELEVRALTDRRCSATVAATLFVEDEAGRQRRQRLAEERKLRRSEAPERRPDKRQRRQIRALRQS